MQCIKRPRGSFPGAEDGRFHCEYNFRDYFSAVLSGRPAPELKKEAHDYIIENASAVDGIKEYAEKIVWFGRKNIRKIYLDEIHDETEEMQTPPAQQTVREGFSQITLPAD